MGVSTDGQICFGIAFEECWFPWDETHGGDIDEWWKEACGFGFTSLPVELVNYCSMGSPMYILAVPGTCNYASRGYPTIIITENLIVTLREKTDLEIFCNSYLNDCEMVDPNPQWYLSSYWEQ